MASACGYVWPNAPAEGPRRPAGACPLRRSGGRCGSTLLVGAALGHDAVTLGGMCVGIPALLQGTIKAKEERRGTPADGFAVAWILRDIARSTPNGPESAPAAEVP